MITVRKRREAKNKINLSLAFEINSTLINLNNLVINKLITLLYFDKILSVYNIICITKMTK